MKAVKFKGYGDNSQDKQSKLQVEEKTASDAKYNDKYLSRKRYGKRTDGGYYVDINLKTYLDGCVGRDVDHIVNSIVKKTRGEYCKMYVRDMINLWIRPNYGYHEAFYIENNILKKHKQTKLKNKKRYYNNVWFYDGEYYGKIKNIWYQVEFVDPNIVNWPKENTYISYYKNKEVYTKIKKQANKREIKKLLAHYGN